MKRIFRLIKEFFLRLFKGPIRKRVEIKQYPVYIPTVRDNLMVICINNHRKSLGRAPLVNDTPLALEVAAIAASHSQYMVDNNVVNHFGSDDRFDQVKARKPSIKYLGECVASNFSSASSTVNAWLKSSGHREALEDPRFTHVGVGKVGIAVTIILFKDE